MSDVDHTQPFPVRSTYRLQLHTGFTFADAAAVAPYVAQLGVSHLYLSPILSARPGSTHGYDVLDHPRISPELGGEDGFRELARRAHELGLGIIVDVVPNHMALPTPEWQNEVLWDVLRFGRSSEHATWFDVDYDALDGRLGLPILGADLDEARSDITLDIGRADEGPAAGLAVVRYFEHVLPVAPDSLPAGVALADVDVSGLLDAQHYRLASWRDKETVLNYRRFFEVDGLIAVRVELPEVFEATHEVLLRLHHEGLIQGFRIDHPDGLADPEGYLSQLRSRLRPGTPVWVEKILEGDEALPESWACDGTTGYDAMYAIDVAMTPRHTACALTDAWAAAGGEVDGHVVMERSKRYAVSQLLRPEVARLVRRASEVLPAHDEPTLRAALEEILVGLEVYRAYVRPGHPVARAARNHLADGLDRARAARPDLIPTIDALGSVLAAPDPSSPAAVDLAVRMQQVTGPVMAKGLEDTAFYRYHRLVARNEVGGDPVQAAAPELGPWLRWVARQARHPRGMTALTTHDTKRTGDVRARLMALAADQDAWTELSLLSHEVARAHGSDPRVAHLLWQTVAGVWPAPRERLAEYLVKALREGKEVSAWVDGDEAAEQRHTDLLDAMLGDQALMGALEKALYDNRESIRRTTLAMHALQLVSPGVPDTYQGSERELLALVDPDNRRPVDFGLAQERLIALQGGQPPRDLGDEIQLLTHVVLTWRREEPTWFEPTAQAVVEGDGSTLLLTRAGGLGVRVAAPGAELPDLPNGYALITPLGS